MNSTAARVSPVVSVSLACFVVCDNRKETEPLFVAVDLDSRKAFDRAKEFTRQLNRVRQNSEAVLQKGTADLAWKVWGRRVKR